MQPVDVQPLDGEVAAALLRNLGFLKAKAKRTLQGLPPDDSPSAIQTNTALFQVYEQALEHRRLNQLDRAGSVVGDTFPLMQGLIDSIHDAAIQAKMVSIYRSALEVIWASHAFVTESVLDAYSEPRSTGREVG